MTQSQSDPSIAVFDSEFKRTLLHIRQVKHRLDYTASTSAPFEEHSSTLVQSDNDLDSSFNEGTSYSSIGTPDIPLSIVGDNDMGEPRRIFLHEQGVLDIVLQLLQARNSNIDANFELKNSMINLLPKHHGLLAQDPIRHLRDFQVACSTSRRHGSNEVAVMVFAFPFSLEGQVKKWFYA
ncbi:hypothetical protein AHAS_Ahas10G0138000 [Arachis hypogaea]